MCRNEILTNELNSPNRASSVGHVSACGPPVISNAVCLCGNWSCSLTQRCWRPESIPPSPSSDGSCRQSPHYIARTGLFARLFLSYRATSHALFCLTPLSLCPSSISCRPSRATVRRPVSGVMVPCCPSRPQPVPYLPRPRPPSR